MTILTESNSNNPYQIPYNQLDTAYFDEFIPSLHPSLRPLATDLRILRHETVERHISTVEKLYKVHVGFIPWLLDDIFVVQSEDVLILGTAWLLTFIDVAMTDSLVDSELPTEPLLPLLQQQIRLQAEKNYRQVFPSSLIFWSAYSQAYIDGLNGLAHEAYCTDAHQEAYTYAQLEEVYQGKGAIYRLMVKAMAELSGQNAICSQIEAVYHKLALVDQLLDDASDWQDDFERKHITVPIIMAIHSADFPFSDIHNLRPEELEGWLYYFNIFVQIADSCLDLLSSAQAILNDLNLDESKLAHFVAKRHRIVTRRKAQYKGLRMLKAMLVSFSGN